MSKSSTRLKAETLKDWIKSLNYLKVIYIFFLTFFISFASFGQGSVTPLGSPQNSVEVKSLGTSKSAVIKVESPNGGTPKNQVVTTVIQSGKTAQTTVSTTSGTPTITQLSADSDKSSSTTVTPAFSRTDVEDANTQRITKIISHTDSIQIRSDDENTGTYSELKLKPLSVTQVVESGTQKAKVFVDWTKSETIIKSGSDSTFQTIGLENIQNTTKAFGIEIVDPVYYNSTNFSKGPSGEPINEINMGESAGTKSASQHWGEVLIAYDVADGATQSRVDLESGEFKVTSTDGTNTTTQTTIPTENKSRSTDGTNVSIANVTTTSVDLTCTDDIKTSEIHVTGPLLHFYSQDENGNVSSLNFSATESITVNTQGTAIGTVRAGAESSYLKNEDGDKVSGVYASSENVLIESINNATGGSSVSDFSPTAVVTTLTNGIITNTSTLTAGGYTTTTSDGTNSTILRQENQDFSWETGDDATNSYSRLEGHPVKIVSSVMVGNITSKVSNDPGFDGDGTGISSLNTVTNEFGQLSVQPSTISAGVNVGSNNTSVVVESTNVKSLSTDGTNSGSVLITPTTATYKVEGALVNSTLVQTANNFTSTAETIYLFAGASGIEASNTSVFISSPEINLDGVIGVTDVVASLNLPSTASGTESELTLTYPGAIVGDKIISGFPVFPAGGMYTAFVSAPNTVTVRFYVYGGSSIDPSTADFKFTILK